MTSSRDDVVSRMPNPGIRFRPVLIAILFVVPGARAQVRYQLLLKGGHVVDPRNQVDAVAHRAELYRRPRRPYTLTPFDCVGTYTFPFATTGGANFVKSPRASRAVFVSEL